MWSLIRWILLPITFNLFYTSYPSCRIRLSASYCKITALDRRLCATLFSAT
ncbi:hypothetical protein BVRB_5g122440 [Beta vulgaris subsp. vulgaris]|nr:hypothetical protein BVRB_5g122440 [Beta vulgaris subsp. vulgaris]